jgi:glutathione S-transferase
LNPFQSVILKEPKFRQELIAGGGKKQVPCLKIEEENGATQWLYESRDIIKYLQKMATSLDLVAE